MPAYYNEIDPYAAQWLRNLIAAGHIASGDVDTRSITEVMPDDLKGYTQCHFFAGIGGWSLALRLTGWGDERPVWTGSCPCQPFSVAGKGKAQIDERHLWPHWFRLIVAIRPSVVFGEQVAGAIAHGWLDDAFDDLEREGYETGAVVLPACSVGAPHKRDRLWLVGKSNGERSFARQQTSEASRYGNTIIATSSDASTTANSAQQSERKSPDKTDSISACGEARHESIDSGEPIPNPTGARLFPASQPGIYSGEAGAGSWNEQSERLHSDDAYSHGKSPERPSIAWSKCDFWGIEPTVGRVANGIHARAHKLRAYGNAIVPALAAEFIKAYMSCEP